MTLMRWSPVHDLPSVPGDVLNIQREINRMFDSFFRAGADDEGLLPSTWNPPVDIAEHDDTFVVRMELPGVSRDDVKISMQQNQLTVRGEKKRETETKKSDFQRVERCYGSFQRTFTLPSVVKAEKIDATYRDGILTITLPKAEEAKAKEIEIKVK